MDQNKVDQFFMQNSKFFPESRLSFLKERISKLDDDKFQALASLEFKEPQTMLLISIFGGC
ncbi:MAG: hypothetical protein Q4D14_02575, partial [Bacteroidales bacterium]|nr:hypothetical protein [Bacteroidales bacterium]